MSSRYRSLLPDRQSAGTPSAGKQQSRCHKLHIVRVLRYSAAGHALPAPLSWLTKWEDPRAGRGTLAHELLQHGQPHKRYCCLLTSSTTDFRVGVALWQ